MQPRNGKQANIAAVFCHFDVVVVDCFVKAGEHVGNAGLGSDVLRGKIQQMFVPMHYQGPAVCCVC